MNPQARHQARQYALQALYQWHMSHIPVADLELQFITREIKKPTDTEYFKELIQKVTTLHDSIDQTMTPFLKRACNELDPIELACLRIAMYELLHRPDVPYRVVINEALELTKRYGSIEGYKFVNGALDQAARVLRATEWNAKKS